MTAPTLRFDKVGDWSQIKLEIVRDYAKAYAKILAKQPSLRHIYIDAFAGAGIHEIKSTGQLIPGSPLNALAVDPPFAELHLIDLDGARAAHLRELSGARKDVHVYEADCNDVLLHKVFPTMTYAAYRRALCLLDPYGLNLRWDVMAKAAEMRTIEIFLNFPVMDMNRNALWSNPSRVAPENAERMTRFWGDDSWRSVMYATQGNLFEADDLIKSGSNDTIAGAFRARLRDVAGFAHVPEPIPMRNSKKAIVYYLFFASPNPTGAKIASHIMKKYAKERG